jgi:hypothetical protein
MDLKPSRRTLLEKSPSSYSHKRESYRAERRGFVEGLGPYPRMRNKRLKTTLRKSWSLTKLPIGSKLRAALAGVGVGGAVGLIARGPDWDGIPEYEAKRYEGPVKTGHILLSAHCDDSKWTTKAKDILERTGAEDVSSTAEAGADFPRTDRWNELVDGSRSVGPARRAGPSAGGFRS